MAEEKKLRRETLHQLAHRDDDVETTGVKKYRYTAKIPGGVFQLLK